MNEESLDERIQFRDAEFPVDNQLQVLKRIPQKGRAKEKIKRWNSLTAKQSRLEVLRLLKKAKKLTRNQKKSMKEIILNALRIVYKYGLEDGRNSMPQNQKKLTDKGLEAQAKIAINEIIEGVYI